MSNGSSIRENGVYTDESLWLLSKQLFNKINNNQTMLSDSLMNAFYQSNQNTDMAGLVNVDGASSQLMTTNNATTNQLRNRRDSLANTNNAANNLLQGFNITALDTSAIDSLINLITILQNRIAQQSNEGDSLQRNTENTETNEADNVRVTNAVISTTNEIANYEQIFNEIYLSTIGAHVYEFNSIQKSQLYLIANLCPIAYGEVVYKARSMYAMVDNAATYNDMAACSAIGINFKKGKPKPPVSVDNIVLFPNPTDETATIIFNSKTKAGTLLEISNMFGQLVKVIVIEDLLEYKFRTIEWAPGIYHITVHDAERKLFSQNLVLIHK